MQSAAKTSPHIIIILDLETFKVFSINFARFEDQKPFLTAVIKDKWQFSFKMKIKSKYKLTGTLSNYSKPLPPSDLATTTWLPTQANWFNTQTASLPSTLPPVQNFKECFLSTSTTTNAFNCVSCQNKNHNLIAKYCLPPPPPRPNMVQLFGSYISIYQSLVWRQQFSQRKTVVPPQFISPNYKQDYCYY